MEPGASLDPPVDPVPAEAPLIYDFAHYDSFRLLLSIPSPLWDQILLVTNRVDPPKILWGRLAPKILWDPDLEPMPALPPPSLQQVVLLTSLMPLPKRSDAPSAAGGSNARVVEKWEEL